MADRIDKLEAAVRKLAQDVGEMKRDYATREDLSIFREEMLEGFEGISKELKEQRRVTAALTDAMTQAVKQLAVGKSIEVRVARLEAVVFGSKH